MARPKKDAVLDLAQRVNLTVGAIERLCCPPDKQQAFLRDSEVPGLRVRVTTAGAKSFVYEAKLNRQTIRRTIGDVKLWTIEQARAEARRLAVSLDNGQDPRELERQQQEEAKALKAAAQVQAITFLEAWTEYVQERQPLWGERHYTEHLSMIRAGGVFSARGTRGKSQTIAGALYFFTPTPLRDITPAIVEAWAAKEGKTRPTVGRLAWRLLRAFFSWCQEHPVYSETLLHENPAKTRKAREMLGKAGVKQDALLKEQLPTWFEAVRTIANPTVSAYLQVVLMTGARPGEVLGMRWEDMNTQWRGLTIRDKVEGERVIPLTPYVHHLLATLPRRNAYVFASNRVSDAPLTEPNHAHDRACKVAGVPDLTLHGLRRSFKSLTEWLECPAGVVAQIMGHKPSATAEKHYTVRPLDLLRLHHERIEAWILEQAQVQFDTQEKPEQLRAVS